MISIRRKLMAKTSQIPSPTWLGLSRVEVTANQDLTSASDVYAWINSYVPGSAWYWIACIEMDLTSLPSENNQFVLMCKIAGRSGVGSFLRFRTGGYQANVSDGYNARTYDLAVFAGQKISIFYSNGDNLVPGIVPIPYSSLNLAVTRVQTTTSSAEQVKDLLSGIHNGMIATVLDTNHADTSNYVSNNNYIMSAVNDAFGGNYARWRNGAVNTQGAFSSAYDLVLHTRDILVSIFN